MKLFRISITAIVSIIIFIFAAQPSTSCLDLPMGDDLRFSAFQPDLAGTPGLSPFYFSANLFNESDSDPGGPWYDEVRTITCDEGANSEEWRTYFNHQPTEAAIDSVLYQTSPDDFTSTVTRYGKEKFQPGETLYRNKFMKMLLSRPEALQYMLFAKRCEHQGEYDPWSEEPAQDTQNAYLLGLGLKSYKATLDTFLKARYAYQLVRLVKGRSRTIGYYDSLMKPLNSESIVKYWALSFKANALNAEGKKAQANYLLSKVFEHVDDKQRRASSGFDIRYLDASIKLARNDHEKAILLAMKELRNPGRALLNIKKIHRLDAHCKELEMLLTREVNKVEDWLLTPAIIGADPAAGHNPTHIIYDKDYNELYSWVNREADKKYLDELLNYVSITADEGDVRTPALWHTAAAYLSMMKGDDKLSLIYIEKAKHAKGKIKMIETQLRLTRALAAAGLLSKDSMAGHTVQEELLWLDKNWKQLYKPARIMEHFMLALSERFAVAGDTVTAALLRYKTAFYSEEREAWDGQNDKGFEFLDEKGSPTVMDKLMDRLTGDNKSAYELYLSREAYADRYRLYDLQGIWHIRCDQLPQALTAFRSVKDSTYSDMRSITPLDANPFYVNFNNPHRTNRHDSTHYTKVQMLETLIRLKEEAAKGGPGAAEKYLMIGNAYFSMTWHGNSWMMTRQWWSISGPGEVWWRKTFRQPAVDMNYYGCTRAKYYYRKAMDLSKDQEQAALCCLMLAICDKNYTEYVYHHSKNRGRYKTYYLLFHDRYSDTRFYQGLISECPGLSSFIGRYRN